MAKRIVICCSGSRGDNQPYVALALRLRELGHSVKICSEARMQSFIESFGIEYHKIAGDPTAILWEKDAQEMLRDGKVMQVMSKMEGYIIPHFQEALKDYEEGCADADIIVTHPLCINQTYSIAEKMKVPHISVVLGATRSNEFPFSFLKSSSFGIRFLNKLSWTLIFTLLWQNEKKRINPWRVNHLKLPPITDWTGIVSRYDEDLPLILAINRAVIPNSRVPADWPKHWLVSGFFFVPPTPIDLVKPEIRNFVENTMTDKPLIYLGFGSMPAPDPEVLIKRAVVVAKKLDVRVVLCAGWSEIKNLVNPAPTNLLTDHEDEPNEKRISIPENLLLVAAVEHDYLFPYCAAVVHHCGVGTTAATLRAGVPSLPCPVMLDQPYNAERLFQLQVAPPPIPFHELTTPRLIKALGIIINTPSFKSNAAAIAADIATQDGTLTAANYILSAPNIFAAKPRRGQ